MGVTQIMAFLLLLSVGCVPTFRRTFPLARYQIVYTSDGTVPVYNTHVLLPVTKASS